MKLKKAMNKKGWAGWLGGVIYNTPKGATPEQIENLLKEKAKETSNGAVILTPDNDLKGFGYTDERYKDGPYFWPIFIECDKPQKLEITLEFDTPEDLKLFREYQQLCRDNPHTVTGLNAGLGCSSLRHSKIK